MLDCLLEFDGLKTDNIIAGDSALIDDVVTFRFSRFTTSVFDGTGIRDPLGSVTFLPFVNTPTLLSNSIEIAPVLGGKLNVTSGGFILANHTLDRPLDYLRNYEFTGRKVKQWFIEEGENYDPNVPDLEYSIENVAFADTTITFRIKTDRTEFERPILTAKYEGTIPPIGVLGLEGRPQLKDSFKPYLLGRVNNFSPILCNESLLIYQVSVEAAAGIINVFTKGSYLTRGADYTVLTSTGTPPNSTGLQSEDDAPAAGTYRVYSGVEGTFIRLGSAVGQITVTGWSETTYLGNSAAGLLKKLLDRLNSILTGEGKPIIAYTLSAFEKLDEKNCASIGLFLTDTTTYSDAFTKICQTVGASWGMDNQGAFTVQYLSEPDQVYANADFAYECLEHDPALVNETGIQSLEINDFQIDGKAAPLWQLNSKSDRNFTVLDSNSLAGIAIESGRQDWFGKEYRTASLEDSANKTKYPLASTNELEYTFSGTQAGFAENNRRFEMFKKKRKVYTVVARLPLDDLKSLYSGLKVWIRFGRLIPSGGLNGLIINYDPNYQTQVVTMDLWA